MPASPACSLLLAEHSAVPILGVGVPLLRAASGEPLAREAVGCGLDALGLFHTLEPSSIMLNVPPPQAGAAWPTLLALGESTGHTAVRRQQSCRRRAEASCSHSQPRVGRVTERLSAHTVAPDKFWPLVGAQEIGCQPETFTKPLCQLCPEAGPGTGLPSLQGLCPAGAAERRTPGLAA